MIKLNAMIHFPDQEYNLIGSSPSMLDLTSVSKVRSIWSLPGSSLLAGPVSPPLRGWKGSSRGLWL